MANSVEHARAETDAERMHRRADEARAAVAKAYPALLENSGVDTTLNELMLSQTVRERLDNAYRFELSLERLRSLPLAKPSKDR